MSKSMIATRSQWRASNACKAPAATLLKIQNPHDFALSSNPRYPALHKYNDEVREVNEVLTGVLEVSRRKMRFYFFQEEYNPLHERLRLQLCELLSKYLMWTLYHKLQSFSILHWLCDKYSFEHTEWKEWDRQDVLFSLHLRKFWGITIQNGQIRTQ